MPADAVHTLDLSFDGDVHDSANSCNLVENALGSNWRLQDGLQAIQGLQDRSHQHAGAVLG